MSSYKRPNASRPEDGFSLLERLPDCLFWHIAQNLLDSQTSDFVLCRMGSSPWLETTMTHDQNLYGFHEDGKDTVVRGVVCDGHLYVTEVPEHARSLNPDGSDSLFGNKDGEAWSVYTKTPQMSALPGHGERLVRDGDSLRVSQGFASRFRVKLLYKHDQVTDDVGDSVWNSGPSNSDTYQRVKHHKNTLYMPLDGSLCAEGSVTLPIMVLSKRLRIQATTRFVARLPVLARLDSHVPEGTPPPTPHIWFATVPVPWIDQMQNQKTRSLAEMVHDEVESDYFSPQHSMFFKKVGARNRFARYTPTPIMVATDAPLIKAMLVYSFYCANTRFVDLSTKEGVMWLFEEAKKDYFSFEYSTDGRHVKHTPPGKALRIAPGIDEEVEDLLAM